MKVLVCGGRTFSNRGLLIKTLSDLDKQHGIDTVIQGGASGADALAFLWAKHHDKDVLTFVADWKTYGRGAGHLRNQVMLDQGPDLVVAFPGGAGTNNMVAKTLMAGVRILQISDNGSKEDR